MASDSTTFITIQQRRLVVVASGEAELVSKEETVRLGPYGILIRTSLSLISVGTELTHFEGIRRGAQYPLTHSATVVGTVAAMGPAVNRVRGDLQLGQRVVAKGAHAAFSHLDVLSQPIAPVRDSENATALFARLGGVAVAAANLLRDHQFSSASVIGLGIVGQLVLRAVKSIGDMQLSGCDRHKNRRDAGQLDDSVILVSAASELPTSDVVFVACESHGVIENALSATTDQGMLVLVGAGGGLQSLDLASHVFRRNVQLRGAHERWGAWLRPEDQLMSGLLLLADQELKLANDMYKLLPASEAVAAYSDLLPFKSQYIAAAVDWTLEAK